MTQGLNACPALFMASYDFEVPFKSIFNLVLAAGGMLAGAQSQILAPGHAKTIKWSIIALNAQQSIYNAHDA